VKKGCGLTFAGNKQKTLETHGFQGFWSC